MKKLFATTALSLACILGTKVLADGHEGNDLRGTWTAGSLTASAIIPQSILLLSTNTEIAWCVQVTNGVGVTIWSGDITNISPIVSGPIGGAFPGGATMITASNATNTVAFAWGVTNIDNTVTNTGTGGDILGTNNAPNIECKQIDGLVIVHTVYGVGVGTTAAGTWKVIVKGP